MPTTLLCLRWPLAALLVLCANALCILTTWKCTWVSRVLCKHALNITVNDAGKHAHLTGPQELKRLQGILESLETTEEQDRALLTGK